jgi:hypothetical protein
MPVQTQSAVVWLLGLPEYLTEQTRSSFFLLKYQSIITMTLAALLSFLALRRNPDLFRVGLLVALLFFLTSKKVMGYHYVLVAPFLLIVCLPQRRFDLIGIVLLAASWIVLSPYYAPWARPQHLALYAAIATPNTVLWLWLLWHVWRGHSAILVGRFNLTQRLADGSAVMIGLAVVTLGMILSGLGQPWGASTPAAQIALLVAVVAGALLLAVPAARLVWQPARRLEAGHVAIAVLVLPVYFAAFTLTAESTRIIEGLLP